MASFQARIGSRRPRKREKKLSFRSIPTRRLLINSKKTVKKIKKLKKFS